ncbi:MAG TPA: metal ABC transporter permease [Acidimicrobiales bacterium]|nr:metal ABC transporter permease [Acidimicrobiales bacterium]
MNLPLPWPFEREYMQLALVAGVIVGASAPLIGTFLAQRRMALLGDGLGHVAFAGVAAGLLLGVAPVWTAMAAAAGAALTLDVLRTRARASGELALAVIFYTGIAAGVVITSRAGEFDASVLSYLFGSVLTVAPGDVVVVAALGLGVVAIVGALSRTLFAIVLDEEAARVAGLPVAAANRLLAVLTAVTVVAAMRVVGLLLVAALMALPVGAAQVLAKSFRASLAVAAGIGVGSVIIGLGIARAADLAPGGTIVLVAAATFALASMFSGRRRRPARP